jgi:hypothetical protein
MTWLVIIYIVGFLASWALGTYWTYRVQKEVNLITFLGLFFASAASWFTLFILIVFIVGDDIIIFKKKEE